MQITDFFERIIQPSGSLETGTQQGSKSSRKAVRGRGGTPEQRRRLLADAALRRLQGSSDPGAEAEEVDAKPGASALDARATAAPKKLKHHHDQGCAGNTVMPATTEDKAPDSAKGKGVIERECVIIDDEGPGELPGSSMAGAGGSTPSTSEWVDLASGAPAAGDSEGGADSAQQQAAVVCPCCGRRWAAFAISNAEHNAHVDACLVGQVV